MVLNSFWDSLKKFWQDTVVDFVDQILPEGELFNSSTHQWATADCHLRRGFHIVAGNQRDCSITGQSSRRPKG